MGEACVVNASPLIFLARGGHLDLLKIFGGPVSVPKPWPRKSAGAGRPIRPPVPWPK